MEKCRLIFVPNRNLRHVLKKMLVYFYCYSDSKFISFLPNGLTINSNLKKNYSQVSWNYAAMNEIFKVKTIEKQ